MLQCFLALSREDRVDTGVVPSHAGEPFYLSLGYEEIDQVRVPDDGDTRAFSQRVLLYRADA
jgi:hypothetical protein